MGKKWLSKGKYLSGLDAIAFACKGLGHSLKADSFRRFGFPTILPQLVLVGITYKCNSRCKSCGIWRIYQQEPEKVKEEMTLDEFHEFTATNNFLEDIILTGGEPFLRKDLLDMWMRLDELGFRTGTTTNALRTDYIKKTEEKLLKELPRKNYHSLQISIDGLGQRHDYIRGVRGNFDKAIDLLRWSLRKKKEYDFFDTSISFTITQSNYTELPEYVDFFIEFGLRPDQISFRPCQQGPHYYGYIESDENFINVSEVISVIRQVQKKYNYYQEDPFVQGIMRYLEKPDRLVMPCYAAFTFYYIDPYWNVYPCISFDRKLGNLRDFDFKIKSIADNEVTHRVREEIKKGKCPNCWSKCSTQRSMLSNTGWLLKLGWANKNRLFKRT